MRVPNLSSRDLLVAFLALKDHVDALNKLQAAEATIARQARIDQMLSVMRVIYPSIEMFLTNDLTAA